jgi:hypothetical protein
MMESGWMRYAGSHLCATTYDNIIGAGELVLGLAARNLIEELNLMSTGELCTFAEAEQDAAWQAAMQEEIDSIERNRTWKLANLP